MADSETSETQQPVDQQVISKTSAAKQKNPKRVAQEKALAEAPPVADTLSTDPLVETAKNVLKTKQWLSPISIFGLFAGFALANAFSITAKLVDFIAERHPSLYADGYPLAGVDEVPTAKQSSVNGA